MNILVFDDDLMYNADGDKIVRAFGNLIKNKGATIPKYKLEKLFVNFKMFIFKRISHKTKS